MLISVRHLVDRIRHPRSRADELASLRARFAAQPERWQVSEKERAIADRLRRLRVEMSEAFDAVDACHGCAKGHGLPHGRWDGGHCCGGRTLDIFHPDEVAALKLGGTSLADLPVPSDDHAGCVFRGPRGCSLEPADRPTLCVRYICLELRSELRARDDWRKVAACARALGDAFREFVAEREPRVSEPRAVLQRSSLGTQPPTTITLERP